MDGTSSLYLKRIFTHPWDDLFDYCGTQSTNGISSLYPRGLPRPWNDDYFDYHSSQTSDGTCSLSPKWTRSSTRRELIDYYGTWSEKRRHLKKSYLSSRWKRHNLYTHTRWTIKKSSYKRTCQLVDPKFISTWQREDTVDPTDLSALQSGRP